MAAIPEMVRTVAQKMSESSEKLNGVDDRVTLNSASITVLKNSVKTLEERKDEQPASRSSSLSPPSDNRSSIAEALAKQTHFNTALSLGHSPTMVFGGELHKYVQFVTMF